jgi:protein-S-isoprenylcysteine O-methyltransferase Ste14
MSTLSAAGWLPEMTNQAPTSTGIMSRMGKFFFRYRNGLFPLIFLVLALLLRPALFLGHEKLDLFVTYIGILLALAGGLVRMLTIGLVYIRRGGKDYKVYAKGLVTDGIYAHVRNPMYVGNLLIAIGICLIHGSPWLYAGAFPFFLLVYISIVAEEERFLVSAFGEGYLTYCQSVPRFWPDLRGISRTFGNYQFNWRRVLKKEYGTTCALLATVYVLVLWEYWYLRGMPTDQVLRPEKVAPLLVLLAFYLGVFFLKKSRRI